MAVTIHGAHELDPAMPQERTLIARLNRLRRRTAYCRMTRGAEVVLTVSEFLKRQVVDWFGVPEEKVVVVGNGVEEHFFTAAQDPAGVSGEPPERPYLLCVGGLNNLDGGDRVIKVARLLQKQLPEFRILVAGWQHNPVARAQAAELSNLQLLGFVESSRLAKLMRDAFALLYLTRYETFGIAAAEAMATGTPVITCRTTAVPEVVGDDGLYVNADEPEETLAAVRLLMEQPSYRERLIQAGRNRARAYTWAGCVERLCKALDGHHRR